jgi:hypothetical protein
MKAYFSWIAVGWLAWCGLASSPALLAQAGAIEQVMKKDGKVVYRQGGQTQALRLEITLAGNVTFMTNGLFKVGDGKLRELKEGQTLRADGTLLSADGSLMPVIDHLSVQAGRVVLVKDGDSAAVSAAMALPDGSRLQPDGTRVFRDGRQVRLMDGQLLGLNGSPLPAQDTVVLLAGKVSVQKDGSILVLRPNQSLMMSDGTKVLGTGTVTRKDGSTINLTEGQVMVMEGVAPRLP